jgi:RimJ/RimL family protein N-acetyltransferase
MQATIERLAEAHFEQLRTVADIVARERRYLAMVEAPPLEQAVIFYRTMLTDGQCHVALCNGQVIGWCDVLPSFGESRRHVGTLGMGLLPAYRGQGIGARLMETAIALAWQRGLSRIELTVREDNLRAKALYERLGFEHEGVKRRSMQFDGKYFNCHAMAILRKDDA